LSDFEFAIIPIGVYISHMSAQLDILLQAKKEARRDGVFAGVTSGFTAALLGQRLMGLNRNAMMFCGVVTGALSGYFFTQAFLSSNMARIKAQNTMLTSSGDLGNKPDHQVNV